MLTIWFNEGYASVREELLLVRAGAQAAGIDVTLVASHRDPTAPALAAADIALASPPISPSDARYLDWALSICAEQAVDLFVPQMGRHWLAPHVARFATAGTRLSVPADQPTLRLIDDKARFYHAALAHGLAMPVTHEVRDAAGFDAALADLTARGLVACIKPPEGTYGLGFWQLEPGRADFAMLMQPEHRRIAPERVRDAFAATQGERLLVLEYLAGDEWSIDCVARAGETLALVARRKLGHVQRIEVEGPAVALTRRAVAAFGLSGLFNVQIRAGDDEGDVRLLEINTRMSGGCFHTIHSGINLPWLHVASELRLIDDHDMPLPRGGALVAESLSSRLVEPAPTLVPVHG